MKKIVERNLPLDTKYTVIDRKYVPILDGYGCTCANCGQPIANIATVKSENGTYEIGFDCMKTFLLNNALLENFDVDQHAKVLKMIPKVIRLGKQVKEFIEMNPNITLAGLEFEVPSYESDWITWYYIYDRGARYNTNIKLKDVDFDFVVSTVINIFPNLEITKSK